ncbi:threonine aldolase family protein [Cohnella panacarvi]|uniref:threonine aldolase family protein n=1 Tax=Cohnella panacarvi TaxID=400776 RepID=UPI00047B2086|nr:beta-eliminating lyase-related protein [Cohnella panacarvi]
MTQLTRTITEAYEHASFPIAGHGKRNIQVLKDALDAYDGDIHSDKYGEGSVIEPFQERMARLLGKPAAVFFPSGTMAQQIALRIWSDAAGTKKVAYHPLSHLELHEKDGVKELHRLEPVLIGDSTRPVELADLLQLEEDVACVLLELPQREIGGQLPAYEELVKMSAYCREKGIKLHLDGARLFECLPYYGKTAAEISELFDSVYVSFYKGLGGIAGAVLAGEPELTEPSKIWKRRHGGDLISLYPYILSAEYYMERRLPLMDRYRRDAQELAALFNECHAVSTLPVVPPTNMFHVRVGMPKERLGPVIVAVTEETGFGFTPYLREDKDGGCAFEISIGDRYAELPKDRLREAFRVLDRRLKASASDSFNL